MLAKQRDTTLEIKSEKIPKEQKPILSDKIREKETENKKVKLLRRDREFANISKSLGSPGKIFQ